MSKIECFEDLKVWQKSRVLCKEIDLMIRNTELKNRWSLRDQMERSSGSIMDNIAEGFGRGGNKEFKTFLGYSKGSCSELKSQLYRCYDFEIIPEELFNKLSNDSEILIKQLGSFIEYLKNSEYKGSRLSEPDILYEPSED